MSTSAPVVRAEIHHSHRDVTGGWLRPAVFGVMDGLVSNIALHVKPSSTIQAGAWSLAFSSPRTHRSTPPWTSRSHTVGERRNDPACVPLTKSKLWLVPALAAAPVAAFFRDPQRDVPEDPTAVVAAINRQRPWATAA